MVTYRPVEEADLPQIRAINTYYILNTSLTFMRTPPPLESYSATLHNLATRGLPYIVAVDGTQKTDEGSDLVVGYAAFSPFRGHLVAYAPTVELTLFVHPHYYSRSVGSNLLHVLLQLVQGGEIHHQCEEPGVEKEPADALDAASRVRNVIAVMAVDPEGKDRGEALRQWYIKRGFVECGRMEKVGFKRGHW